MSVKKIFRVIDAKNVLDLAHVEELRRLEKLVHVTNHMLEINANFINVHKMIYHVMVKESADRTDASVIFLLVGINVKH